MGSTAFTAEPTRPRALACLASPRRGLRWRASPCRAERGLARQWELELSTFLSAGFRISDIGILDTYTPGVHFSGVVPVGGGRRHARRGRRKRGIDPPPCPRMRRIPRYVRARRAFGQRCGIAFGGAFGLIQFRRRHGSTVRGWSRRDHDPLDPALCGSRSGVTRSSGSLIVDQLDRLDRRERPFAQWARGGQRRRSSDDRMTCRMVAGSWSSKSSWVIRGRRAGTMGAGGSDST